MPSSFHLWWQLPPGPTILEVRATLELRIPPSLDRLYFWALQVSFQDRGRDLGAGHTGLQWHPAAPGGAVNWGGYAPAGGELPGTNSPLPAVDSVNTRRFPWQPGNPYQFRVWSPTEGAWRSEVTNTTDGTTTDGTTTVIRDLLVAATELTSPVVWAEVFAPCDDPPTEAAWSDLTAIDSDGQHYPVASVSVTYQAESAGGCSNTEAAVDNRTFVQRTGLDTPRPQATPTELTLDAGPQPLDIK